MSAQKQETMTFLNTMFGDHDKFEVCSFKGGPRMMGIFTADSIAPVIDGVLADVDTQDYYFTPNSVELDGKAWNKVSGRTKDCDVQHRRWLLIDVDPVKADSKYATDEEKSKTVELCDKVVSLLTSEGWGEPVIVDSGSGRHLYYPCSLEQEHEGHVVPRVLTLLHDMFPGEEHGAVIDTAVGNPARLMRLPGSVNQKKPGDAPCRVCKVVQLPERPRKNTLTFDRVLTFLDRHETAEVLTNKKEKKTRQSVPTTPTINFGIQDELDVLSSSIEGYNLTVALLTDRFGWDIVAETCRGDEHKTTLTRPGKGAGGDTDFSTSGDVIFSATKKCFGVFSTAPECSPFPAGAYSYADVAYEAAGRSWPNVRECARKNIPALHDQFASMEQDVAKLVTTSNKEPYSMEERTPTPTNPGNGEKPFRYAELLNDKHAFAGMSLEHTVAVSYEGCKHTPWSKLVPDTAPWKESLLRANRNLDWACQTTIDASAIHLPEEAFNIPGIAGDMLEYSIKSAVRENKELSFAGVLSLLGMLWSRRIQSPTGLMTNLMIVALSSSGSGKEHPRGVTKAILSETGCLGNHFMEEVSSAQGLEDAFLKTPFHPAYIFIWDEFHTLLEKAGKAVGTAAGEAITKIMNYYTSGRTCIKRRALADNPHRNSGQNTAWFPAMNMFSTCTPKGFFNSLQSIHAAGGFLGRLLIIKGEETRATTKIEVDMKLPAKILSWIKSDYQYWKYRPEGQEATYDSQTYFEDGGVGTENYAVKPDLPVMPFTAEGKAFLADSVEHFENSRYEAREDDAAASVWARAGETTIKMAMIYALSRDCATASLDVDALKWGRMIAEYSTNMSLGLLKKHMVQSEYHKIGHDMEEVIEGGMKTNNKPWVSMTNINRLTPGIPKKDKFLVLQDLCEQGKIVAVLREGKRNSAPIFKGYALRRAFINTPKRG